MRFVLVGISVCLAWIAAWRLLSADDSHPQHQHGDDGSGDASSTQQQQRHRQQSAKHSPLQELFSWSTLLDMFTGKYIYNYCTAGSSRGSVVKAS